MNTVLPGENQMTTALRSLRAAAAALVVLATACSNSNEPTVPGTNPEVTNATDNFQLQTSSVTGASTTVTYSWRNTGIAASINQSTTVSAGTMTLTVLDASGAQVYSRSLADNGTYNTLTGTTGNWTIRVVFANASGTVNFRAQRL